MTIYQKNRLNTPSLTFRKDATDGILQKVINSVIPPDKILISSAWDGGYRIHMTRLVQEWAGYSG